MYDYGKSTSVSSINNPSLNEYPYKLIALDNESFILQDDKAVSLVTTQQALLITLYTNGDRGIHIEKSQDKLRILTN